MCTASFIIRITFAIVSSLVAQTFICIQAIESSVKNGKSNKMKKVTPNTNRKHMEWKVKEWIFDLNSNKYELINTFRFVSFHFIVDIQLSPIFVVNFGKVLHYILPSLTELNLVLCCVASDNHHATVALDCCLNDMTHGFRILILFLSVAWAIRWHRTSKYAKE